MNTKFSFMDLRQYLEYTFPKLYIPREAKIGETNFEYKSIPLGIKVNRKRRIVSVFVEFGASLDKDAIKELIQIIQKWKGFKNKYEKYYIIEKENNLISFYNSPNPKHGKHENVVYF